MVVNSNLKMIHPKHHLVSMPKIPRENNFGHGILVHSSVGKWKSPLYPHTKKNHPGDFPHVHIRVESSRLSTETAGEVDPPFGALPFRCQPFVGGCQSGDSLVVPKSGRDCCPWFRNPANQLVW